VADVAIKHTSVGGNNCPENYARRHVTRITTSGFPPQGAAIDAVVISTLEPTPRICHRLSWSGSRHRRKAKQRSWLDCSCDHNHCRQCRKRSLLGSAIPAKGL